MRGDGDGWVACERAHRHWGRYGAAGLLLRHRGQDDDAVLMQHRAEWSHHGGTWGIPGGARDSTEHPVHAALRETEEEAGVSPREVQVHGLRYDDHGGWSYTTVLAAADRRLDARPTGGESVDVRWTPVDEVAALPLHPGFAASWPALRDAGRPLRLVVDAANVVGSRPDGWWKDRAGAAARLRDRLRVLAAQGLPAAALPPDMAPDVAPAAVDVVYADIALVVEGAARRIVEGAARREGGGGGDERVDVVAAPGEGDDEILAQATAYAGPTLVVTADRELCARVQSAGGGTVIGPRWLLDLLDSLERTENPQ